MSKSKQRNQALKIFKAALDASDPIGAINRHLRVDGDLLVAGKKKYLLSSFGRVLVVGAGKAGASMAQAVERLLGKRIETGLINVKYGHLAKLRRIELHECGHPVPDGRRAHRGHRRKRGPERSADLPDLGRRLGAHAQPRPAHHAGGEASHHAVAARLRGQHP